MDTDTEAHTHTHTDTNMDTPPFKITIVIPESWSPANGETETHLKESLGILSVSGKRWCFPSSYGCELLS